MANPWEAFQPSAVPPDVSVTADGRPSITVRPQGAGYDKAISAVESGGNYQAVGPATRDGDRALGKYQVMGKNVGAWTEQYLGKKLTPQEFLASPEAQDAVFQGEFGRLAAKHGPEGAARAWFAGEGGMNDPNRKDVLGTSVADYSRKFTNALNPGTANAATMSQGKPWEAYKQINEQQPSEPFVPQQPDSRPDIGQGRAALEGIISGASANFGDEVYGASKASGLPEILGGFRAPVGAARLAYEHLTGQPGEASSTYERAVAEKRAIQKAAQEQYPGTYLAGNVAGAIVLPGGAGLQAATLPARIGRSAAVGAGYGALSGAGEGENLPDRAVKGATGLAVGGLVGGAAVPALGAVELAGRGIGHVVNPVVSRIKGALDPEKAAAKSIVSGLQRDQSRGLSELTPQEWLAAKAAGVPVTIAELGGETTRGIARASANLSPEGRGALQNLADDRFEGQTGRVVTYLQNVFGFKGDSAAVREGLKSQAQSVNTPAYKNAMQLGDKPLWDKTLESLAEDPIVLSAIRRANIGARADQTQQGVRPFKQPFEFTGASLTLKKDPNGKTVYPNLQFWDLVKRELDKGDRNSQAFARVLRTHLDSLVPEYNGARAGAARFFDAEDAFSAGENFISKNMPASEAQRALAQMSPQERALFKQGFAARLINDISNTSDRVNIANKIGNTLEAKEKLNLVLGPQAHNTLNAMMSVEQSIDKLRTALGNSTSVRQYIELGLAGTSAGYGLAASDPNQIAVIAAIGGRRWVDQRVAKHVATMLTSNDPAVLAKGVKTVQNNQALTKAFRDLDTRLSKVGVQQAPVPALQIPSLSRAEDQQGVPRPPGQ